jgi:hypothetical protein
MYAVTKPCCVLDNLRRASPTTESPQETPGPTQQKEKIGSQESSNAERRAKISRAAADTKVIVTQTLTYYRDKNQYPSNVAGLQNNGYVTSVLDPFSTATPPANYQYTLNGAAFAGQLNAYMTDDIRAWSVGPDGVSGTADDIGYSSQTGAFGWIYSTRNTSPPSPSPIQSSNSSEQITSGEFDSFQSVFERIRLNGPDLPEFKILHMSWGEWGQKGLIEGPAMKVLMSYDKSWVTESPDGTQFYALGRFSLNENEAFLVWAPREWPVKMYVVDPKTHALVTSDIVEYGPQDRGWQLDVETKFVDLNQDGNLDLLIRETGESFEPEDEPGCWEISFVAKLWEKDRFVESNLPNLRTLKEKYFKKKCRRVNPISR